ncbi:alkaline phosphatase family protein [Methylomonas sp. MgM2]
MSMHSQHKTLLVGWDAADWKMIHPLMDSGLMPNLKRLADDGVMANLATLSPVLSPMLWTSIATGKRPFKHGILGFSEPTPDRTGVQPVSNLSRTTKAIWNILNQNGKRCIVVGWWPSHPAEPINGVMVSNHYQCAPKLRQTEWPLLSNTVYPPRLEQMLAKLRLHPSELTAEHLLPFVPHGGEIDQRRDGRIAGIAKTVAECTSIQSAATWLMDNEPWDFAAVYFDGIDHFGHGFMKYHPPQQAFVSDEVYRHYQNVVAAGYVYHDMMLGHLLDRAGKDAIVMLVSDHGFHADHLRPHELPTEPAGPAVEHRDFGVFVMSGPGIKKDVFLHSACLLDVTPTLLTALGLPVGEDMDGRPLDVFDPPRNVETIPSWDAVPGDAGQHPKSRMPDPAESKEVFDRLVALGYIEQPGNDRETAVAKTQRELDYNLARSYMDAGLHGEAASILADLYRRYPLEFRFGIQLILCFQALELVDDMEVLLNDLNVRWRKASLLARDRLKKIAEMAGRRREELRTFKDEIAQAGQTAIPELSENLFSKEEQFIIRDLRAIARGNERTLDYLASSVALAKGDYEKALSYLSDANESETKVPGFHVQLGNTWMKLRRFSQAEASLRKALDLEPENPQALLGLSRTFLAQNQNREALAAAKQSIALKYFNPAAHYFLGISQHRLHQTQAAIASLKRAIAQNPNFAEAHTRLALIYHRALNDQARSAEHRLTALMIRKQRRACRKLRTIPCIANFSDQYIAAQLPGLPDMENTVAPRKPWLGLSLTHAGFEPEPHSERKPFVTIVSGLPRSGTSMMMQMLTFGGMQTYSDGERAADEHNPWGYYELEKVKQLHLRNDWLTDAEGRVVKVVTPLLPYLPRNCAYRVIMMQRSLDEVIRSQKTMLQKLGYQDTGLTDHKVGLALSKQDQIAKKVCDINCVPLLQLRYDDLVYEPERHLEEICNFLGIELDKQAMRMVIRPRAACL